MAAGEEAALSTSESWPATQVQRSNPAATAHPALQVAPGSPARQSEKGPRPARRTAPAILALLAALLALRSATPPTRLLATRPPPAQLYKRPPARREGSPPGPAEGPRPPGSANVPAHLANGPPGPPGSAGGPARGHCRPGSSRTPRRPGAARRVPAWPSRWPAPSRLCERPRPPGKRLPPEKT
ncbi:WAS/WASL-interacting protein family member 1-like [Marmota flaviventris]|uniref:WAS/WASL-interacting protein family member 1-like n=1 Tax=Marmota flaviventris TaxID=93162 RepID=UPI003A86886F